PVGPSRDDVEMQVEDGLAAGFAVELHDLEALGPERPDHGAGGALRRRRQTRQRLRFDFQQVAGLRTLRNDQHVALGLGEDVHEGEDVVVLPHLHRGNLAAQDLREDVVGVVGGFKGHGGSASFRPQASNARRERGAPPAAACYGQGPQGRSACCASSSSSSSPVWPCGWRRRWFPAWASPTPPACCWPRSCWAWPM